MIGHMLREEEDIVVVIIIAIYNVYMKMEG